MILSSAIKKIIAISLIVVSGYAIFALSYKDNTYHRLAAEYKAKANRALDAGQYDMAEEYAKKATENAELSIKFVAKLVAQENAGKLIATAKNRLDWAKSNGMDKSDPDKYSKGSDYYLQARDSYAKGDFDAAVQYAMQCIELFGGTLPKYYVVRPWSESEDCLWNIAARVYVYNTPSLWKKLYQANKDKIPNPDNPDLITPGIKLEIPSIKGENREGVYAPGINYEPISTTN